MEVVLPRCPLPCGLLLLLLLPSPNTGAVIDRPAEEGKEVWGYVTVREDAHMFWWLYYATDRCKSFSELPLIMWLQGGPGGSSTGFGNFEEIGPLDSDLKPRKTTWLQAANLLFVDNPVGTGFSYVNKSDAYAQDLDTVASDMMVLLKIFFSTNREFQSLLDDNGLAEVFKIAEQVLDAVNKKHYKEATLLWDKAEVVIENNTDGVNFYNILTKSSPMSVMESSLEFTQTHLGQAANVFFNMEEDFMKPVISIVDELLKTGINVTVYNGQLDLIVDTMGQEAWIRKLKWSELPKFNQLKWKALYTNPESSETSAFVKSYKNLAFYWILKAGHMVPSDQGDMALKMMRLVTPQE
ncbi:Retinoid-inducible serine carboxypeptidase [Tupaia chinensis]|uniref:Retinoid-inducible serine carboxypeptidase n=1 Tax=Tupaia chinensis TaxID=246437 RepID=L9KFE2_TUPCH|nr:Retinoid-inducible serine carboxypeptidase [Tupaia chinensis]